MIGYILRRLIYMVVVLIAISMVAFFVIQLPPGDYLTVFLANMYGQGMHFSAEQVRIMEERFGLNLPLYVQYLKWARNLVRGDLGLSFSYGRPVLGLVVERLPLTLTFKYPVRVALNPIISTVGWLLPEIVSGSTIVAIVLSLPTVAPLLLRALTSQDSFLAGSIIMILASLTVIGTLASDILLAVTDPRIRFERR